MTREELGRVLHHERRRTDIDHWGISPGNVLGWDELPPEDREATMREAEAVANAVRAEIALRVAERVANLIADATWPDAGTAES